MLDSTLHAEQPARAHGDLRGQPVVIADPAHHDAQQAQQQPGGEQDPERLRDGNREARPFLQPVGKSQRRHQPSCRDA
jgi:hypothetical protein